MPTTLFALLSCLLLAAQSPSWPRIDPEVDWLAASLEGHFSSGNHDLRIDAARIWRNRSDGQWLYVEQAIGSERDHPRQRVLQIRRLPGGTFEIRPYTLPDPLKYVGEETRPEPLQSLSPAELERLDGCEIRVEHRDDGAFTGATALGSCPSDLGGATHATTEVVIWPDRLSIWERGWDVMGRQVWGGTTGGDLFTRVP